MSDMLDPLEPRFPFELEPREPEPNRSPNPLPLLELLERVREDASGRRELTDDERDRFNALVTRTYPHFQTRFRPVDLDDADQRMWEIIEPDLVDARKFDKRLFPVHRTGLVLPDKDRWVTGELKKLARQLQHQDDPHVDLMATPLARGDLAGLTPLRAARLLLTLLRLGPEFDGQIETLVAELRRHPGPLGRGAILFYLATFEKYDEVLSVGYDPRQANLLALEEDVYASYALSIAFTQTGDAREGYALLVGAVRLAMRLQMPGRLDFLNLERVRLLIEEARPNIALLREVRRSPHLTGRQSNFAETMYVDHLMVFGGYAEAYERAGRLEEDLAPERLAFLAALLGREESELGDDKKKGTVLAKAVRTLQRGGTNLVLTPLNGTNALGYADLFEVVALARMDGHAADAAATLGKKRPVFADQRLWWALIALEVAGRGGMLPDVFDPHELLRSALEPLERGGEDVFMAARLLVPLGVALAAHLPEAPAAAVRAFAATPVLTGKLLSWEGREVETPDNNGLGLVYDAMGDERALLIERRGRFDDAIERMNLPIAPLNLGAVVAGARALARRAEEAGLTKGAGLWAAAAARALNKVTTAAPKRKAGGKGEA